MSPRLLFMKNGRKPMPLRRMLVEDLFEQRDRLFALSNQQMAAAGVVRLAGMGKASQGMNIVIAGQQDRFHTQSAQAVDHVQQPKRVRAFGEAVAADNDHGPCCVALEIEVKDVLAAPPDEARRLERAQKGLRVGMQVGKEADASVWPGPRLKFRQGPRLVPRRCFFAVARQAG